MAAPLSIVIVADDALARAGLAALLADEPVLHVAGRVSGTDDLAAAVTLYRPAVLLWDLGWNPLPSLDRLLGAADILPPVAVLLPDATFAATAWLAGGRGLLRRDVAPQVLTAALVALAEGLAVVDPAFTPALQAPQPPASPPSAEARGMPEELTTRELDVLRLLAEGLPNKTIAQRLGISEHTVKFHINAIFGKLGVASRTEAVVRATRLGLLLL